MNAPPPVSRRFLTQWARECLLDIIDEFLADPPSDLDWDADDERALKKERDRIAKFLGMERPKP